MRKFVRYGNRKLHEEGSVSPHVSMTDLGEIVASGAEIRVVDDLTGRDVTVATLARILYDRCRGGHPVDGAAVRRLIVESRKPKTGGASRAA